ncbi:hypothetical protein POTOM_054539 [Populus tomentosa]|uniref:PB1 domain-containing protein n=1 Tax=Populus tomentosa TaxID=118781 RepID=A0A8X8BYL4_POPTO|nr:hypothetical protein POTOM_054539 [Populus tomentosa]
MLIKINFSLWKPLVLASAISWTQVQRVCTDFGCELTEALHLLDFFLSVSQANKRAALSEIADVLRAVCHAHRLPLALTWIPCNYTEEALDEIVKVQHYIEEGQGIAGKALQSNHPFFFSDVKAYDITEYPLVHHARKYGLNAAVAIRLRSTYTGDEDYILEFFLPVNIEGSSDQQLLLNNLSESNSSNEQKMSGSRRQVEKKRSTAEKTVSLSVLQQYFSGSLKDAAKSIGGELHAILPHNTEKNLQTTWNIQMAIPQDKQGGFIAGGAMMQEFDLRNGFVFQEKNLSNRNSDPANHDVVSVRRAPCTDGNNSTVKVENDECHIGSRGVLNESCVHVIDCSEDAKSAAMDAGLCEQANFGSGPWACLENDITGSLAKAGNKWGVQNGGIILENFDSHFVSQSSSSFAKEMDTKMEGDDGNVEHNQPTSSSMTDSSNGTGSMMHGSISSSSSFEERKHSKVQTSFCDGDLKITVKASYKEDIIRFKFDPSAGCLQLYKEVSNRFKLQTGTFQLKYLDDEDEWVLLVSDSDLQECLEIMEYAGTRNVKFLVRDAVAPFVMGSSGSSNSFLVLHHTSHRVEDMLFFGVELPLDFRKVQLNMAKEVVVVETIGALYSYVMYWGALKSRLYRDYISVRDSGNVQV